VPIDTTAFPNAKTADGGALADNNFPRVFDIKITQANGEQWTFATLKTALTAGTFYSTGGGANGDFEPSGAATGANNALAYDTYLTTPDHATNVAVPGKSDYVPGGGGATGKAQMPGTVTGRDTNIDPASFPTSIDATWGALQPWTAASAAAPTGSTYTIARLTVLGKSAGTINTGHISGNLHVNQLPPDVAYSAINIPLNGDLNVDGLVNSGDIPAFIQALSSVAAYQTAFPGSNPFFIGDYNNDGLLNSGDIPGFISILSAAGPVPGSDLAALGALVPEPTSAILMSGLLMGLAARRRRLA